MEIGKPGHQSRNVAAGRLDLYRYRDRVTVILDNKKHRQPQIGSRIQRFPELALAGGTIAQRNVGDLVRMNGDVLELSVVARNFVSGVGMARKVCRSLGATDRLQNLRSGR